MMMSQSVVQVVKCLKLFGVYQSKLFAEEHEVVGQSVDIAV